MDAYSIRDGIASYRLRVYEELCCLAQLRPNEKVCTDLSVHTDSQSNCARIFDVTVQESISYKEVAYIH